MYILLLLLLVSCAPLTVEQRESRDEHYAEALDDYLMRAAECRRSHGFMVRRFTQKQLENRRVHPAQLGLAYCAHRMQ